MYPVGWPAIWHNWLNRKNVKEVSLMSKMSELDAAIAELRKCGETIIGVSETLRELFSSSEPEKAAEAPTPAAETKPAAKQLTLEEVRKVLAQKSVEGHTSQVQFLIRKYGADKLSQVDPACYADLLHEAEVL